jgi:hypothetical protein
MQDNNFITNVYLFLLTFNLEFVFSSYDQFLFLYIIYVLIIVLFFNSDIHCLSFNKKIIYSNLFFL